MSLGPKQFAVPDFSGLTRDGAQALADSYGLAVDFQVIGTTSGTLVFSQNPGVGVTVSYGDLITLYLV
ncbi:MAG: PASTA domain-containing protein [Actinomycetota bacterium]